MTNWAIWWTAMTLLNAAAVASNKKNERLRLLNAASFGVAFVMLLIELVNPLP